jgi:hypothetical protein
VVVSGLPDDDGVIKYGHELKFSCPNPAHQLKGNPQVVCAAGGMWTNRFPTCEGKHFTLAKTKQIFYRQHVPSNVTSGLQMFKTAILGLIYFFPP